MRTTLMLVSVVVVGGVSSACRIERGEHLSGRAATAEVAAVVDQFRVSARADLEDIDARIQQLMALAESATGPRRAELAERVREFQTRSGESEERLRWLTWSDEQTWRRTTGEINQTLQALRGDVLRSLAAPTAADPAPQL